MQDGAPAHNALSVRAIINEHFPNRWIGTNSPHLRWPARSPDMNPLDFFMWGHITNLIHDRKYNNGIELKDAILQACHRILPQSIWNATVLGFERRLRFCLDRQGGHFEHIPKNVLNPELEQ